MITIAICDTRRTLRRRASLLIPATPIVLMLVSVVAKWLEHPLSIITAMSFLMASTLLVFAQAILADRDGRLDMVLAVAPSPRWLPLVRRVLLFIVPLALQLIIYFAGLRLIG